LIVNARKWDEALLAFKIDLIKRLLIEIEVNRHEENWWPEALMDARIAGARKKED